MIQRQKHHLIFLMAFLFLLIGAADAFATHFRFGQITWQKTGPTTVQFTVTSAWRSTFGITASSYIGDLGDGSSLTPGPVIATLNDLNGEPYNIHRKVFTKTYASTGPYTAQINSCCRISTLAGGNNDTPFIVRAVVDLRGTQTGSTISSITPLLQWPQGPNSVVLPTADPDSTSVSCALAVPSNAGYNSNPIAGGNALTVSSDCTLSWDASSASDLSKWAVQVELTEGGITTDLDFIIEVNGQLALNDAPACTLNGATNNTIGVGQPFAISATGSDTDDTQLTLTAIGVPAGATLVPASGTNQSIPFNATLNFTPATVGSHAITLNYSDDQNAQGACNFSVNVVNAPPVADAGTDQAVDEETGATLSGADSSDPFGRALTYSWVQIAGPGVTGLSGAGTAAPTFTAPPVLVDTVVTFELTVNNGSLTDVDTVDVLVRNTNSPPVADAGTNQIVEQAGPAGSNVTLNGSGSSDPDNDALTYSWTGVFGTASGATPSVLIPAGTHTVTLVVNDGSVDSAPATMSVTVQDTIKPVITVNDRTEEATGPSTPVDVSADASAADAVGVVTLSSDTPGTFPANITTVVTWTATDAAGNISTATQNVTIQDTIAPVLTAPADVTADATGSLTMVALGTPVATDAVGVLPLTNDAPAGGFPVDSTTVVTWTACDAAENCSSATQTVIVLPFDLGINIGKTKLKIHHGHDHDKDKDKDKDHGAKDWLQIAGTLTPFSNGDGIDFLTEPMTIILNGFTWNLPPGSFVRKTSDRDKDKDSHHGIRYEYKGGRTGLTQVVIDENGRFKLKVKRTDLSGLPFATPIPFSVRIDNDFGETDVTFNTRRGKNDDDKGKDKDKDHDKGKKKGKK